MSFYHGLGMFIFGMGAMIVGAIAAYFIKKRRRDGTIWNNNYFYIANRMQRKV